MEQTHTFGIDFLVRKVKGDPTKVFIYARVTIDGEHSEISTKQMISAVTLVAVRLLRVTITNDADLYRKKWSFVFLCLFFIINLIELSTFFVNTLLYQFAVAVNINVEILIEF